MSTDARHLRLVSCTQKNGPERVHMSDCEEFTAPEHHEGQGFTVDAAASRPESHRHYSIAEKMQHVLVYDDARVQGLGAAYLQLHGLCSSQIAEWRSLQHDRERDEVTGRNGMRAG